MDNIGKGKEMVHEETVKALNEKYSRKQWSGCFRDTVELEKRCVCDNVGVAGDLPLTDAAD